MRCLIFGWLIASASFASASITTEIPAHSVWSSMAQKSGIPVDTLYAIALAESGKTIDGEFVPHPFAIAVGKDKSIGQMQHEGFYPASKKEAIDILAQLLADGHTNIGIGMMQINIKHNPDIVPNITMLLDPVINMNAALKVLKWCTQHERISAILSCYSHGSPSSKRGLLYAQKVNQYAHKYSQERFATPPLGQLTYAQLLSVMKKRTDSRLKRRPAPIQIIN